MAEQWFKYFSRLPQKLQSKIETILIMLKNGDTDGLDIKLLKGYSNVYRVRIGDLRLLYKIDNGTVIILKLGSRGDVYKEG